MLNIDVADGIILTKIPAASTIFAAAVIFSISYVNIVSELKGIAM